MSILKRIRSFHRKTMEEYLKDQQTHLEPWKKKVMELHERSGFLFYYDTCELHASDGSQLVIQGDIAKAENDSYEYIPLFFYDGEANLLGEGLLMSDPYEKEEKRRGVLRFRKHECIIRLVSLKGQEFDGLTQKNKNRLLENFFRKVSLISDTHIA